MGPLEALRALGAAILLAYVPGRLWTAVLVPSLEGRIERFVSSVVLSVVLVLLALYFGNTVAHVPVTGNTAFGWSIGLSILAGGILLTPWLHRRVVVVR